MTELMEFKGVLVRKDSGNDKDMVRECLSNYTIFNFDESSIVMDLGGHIGGFAKMALNHPIKQYIAVEADPENFEVLSANANDSRSILYSGAVSASEEDVLVFYQTESKNSKCSGTVAPKSSRSKASRKVRYEVPNHNIFKLFEKHQPTHLKVDIEGAEWPWLEISGGEFPTSVQEISFELHSQDKITEFEKRWLPRVLQDYELIKATPNYGFASKDSEITWDFPDLGVKGPGTLWGLDVFFRRKP